VSESGQNGVRLVVGATGGIGLALVEAQLADPQVAQVIATYRPGSNLSDLNELADVHGTRLRRIPLEVTEQASIDSLENQLGRLRDGVDVAIHATGILHENEIQPEKSVSECTARNLMRLFQVNSVAPLMVARALLATQSRQREPSPRWSAALGTTVSADGTATGRPRRRSISWSERWRWSVE